jgi:hypothetical protein
MFDLKKFLRIEISGYVCILYTALFTTCLIIIYRPGIGYEQVYTGFWYKGPVAAIPVALVLGFIIHQISIRVLNPFCEYRAFPRGPRPVLTAIKKRLEERPGLNKYFKDIYDSLKGHLDMNGLFDLVAGHPTNKNPSYLAYLRDEISRRYSYYYARMDTGLFAPILGFLLSLLITILWFSLGEQGSLQIPYCNCLARWLPLIVSAIFVVVVSCGIVSYSKKLVREIDVLECALLTEVYDASFIKGVLAEYKAGTLEKR